LDYIDWRTVLRIKEEGKHFTPEGEKIVKLLVSPPRPPSLFIVYLVRGYRGTKEEGNVAAS